MPLVGQMPSATECVERKQSASHISQALESAAAAVRHTFQNATEPLTHAQAKKAAAVAHQQEEAHEREEFCLHQQHEAALRNPNQHDKTKIHFMMEAKHNDNFVPNPCDKLQRQPAQAPTAPHKTAFESVKEVFKGRSQECIVRDCLLQQHQAAMANPSARDKVKFAFL